MAEQKTQPKGYYVGEVIQDVGGNRMLVEVIARPDGTGMTDKQWQVEVLNKLDKLLATLS